MNEPSPEAVETVCKWLHYANCEAFCAAPVRHAANFATQAHMVLSATRDLIHRDGSDADAIREALRLTWEQPGRITPRRLVGIDWKEPA